MNSHNVTESYHYISHDQSQSKLTKLSTGKKTLERKRRIVHSMKDLSINLIDLFPEIF